MSRVAIAASFLAGALVGAAATWLVVDPPRGKRGRKRADAAAAAPAPAAAARPVDGSGRPNVVLVIGCTLRHDMLTPYGGPPEASPFVSWMASEGARFDNALSAAPWTKAASTALFSGYHPIQVGMTEPSARANRRRLSEQVTTLAEYLQADGYETIGLTANPNTNTLFGFSQGFDHYEEPERLWTGNEVHKPPTARLVDRILPYVDNRPGDGPLFLQLMVVDTHEPIETTKRQLRPFRDQPKRLAPYLAMVRQLDDGLGHLYEKLGERGLDASNTVFFLVNDHGEGLKYPASHGHGHGNHVQPSTVRMPWVAMGAGIAKGHVIEGMASQVDLLPTVLGVVEASTDYAGPGRDWSAQLRGDSDRTTRTFAIADTWFQRASRAGIYTESTACLHDYLDLAEELGETRLIPKTACYDRVADPLHREPILALDEPLMQQLFAWRTEMEAAYEAWPHHEDIRVTDDVEAQLEALGYVQDEGDLEDAPARAPRRR